MTISGAINHKRIIEHKEYLIAKLTKEFKAKKVSLNDLNTQVTNNALRLAEAALQKDNVKINDGDAIAITEPQINVDMFHLVDPLGLEKLIEEMQNDVDTFNVEIDATLSEINAITEIEI